MSTHAALLLDLTADEPDLGAVQGDRLIIALDGEIKVVHLLTGAEYSAVLAAYPYGSTLMSVHGLITFGADFPAVDVREGDQVYRSKPRGLGKEGDLVICRARSGDAARGAIARLIDDPTCDFCGNGLAEDRDISEDAMLAALRGLYRMIAPAPAPPASAAPALPPLCAEDMSAAGELTRDVPEIGARRGDLLVSRWFGTLQEEPRGRVRWLTMEDYAALEALPREAVRDYREHYGPSYIIRDRRRWGKRLKVWHSRLALVRPWQPETVEPIEASSDDGAIFELLCEVGGRMPTGGAR
jgi:hypothetical protein